MGFLGRAILAGRTVARNGGSDRRTTAPQDHPVEVIAHPVQMASSSFRVTTDNKRRRLAADGTGEFHVDPTSVDRFRRISRWHEHNTGTYSQMLTRWLQYLIGTGPVWLPMTSDESWNQRAAELIANDFDRREHDATRNYSWQGWLDLLARGIARDGQNGCRHTRQGGLLTEAERIIGAETNDEGRIVSWLVAPVTAGGRVDRTKAEPVSASILTNIRNVIYARQPLGIPVMFSTLDDHDGLYELWGAEIDAAAKANAPWAIVDEDPQKIGAGGGSVPSPSPSVAAEKLSQQSPPRAHGADARVKQRGWIQTPEGPYVMGLDGNLRAQAWVPNRPNLDVPEFSKQMLAVCCNVLLPFNIAFDETQGLSFSNTKAVERAGEMLLKNFRTKYLLPTMERLVRQRLRINMLRGHLDENPEWKRGQFVWDKINLLDRNREAQADAIERANGTMSLKDKLGPAWRQHVDQIAEEWDHAAAKTVAHNTKYKGSPEAQITVYNLLGNPQGMAGALAPLIAATNAEDNRVTQPQGTPA